MNRPEEIRPVNGGSGGWKGLRGGGSSAMNPVRLILHDFDVNG
jgi:hypothetical protein